MRPFNAYGPRQSDRAVIPTIIGRAITTGDVRLGSITPTRDFSFVTDPVEGIVRVAEAERAVGCEINLGSGREIPINDWAKKIAALMGGDIKIKQPEGRSRPTKSEVDRLLADNPRARELVGWSPQVALEDCLRTTIKWVREHLAMYQSDRVPHLGSR